MPNVTIRNYDLKYWNNSFIVCPYCDYVDEESCDYPEALDGDYATTTMDCASCAKEFSVTLKISYTYTTKRLEENI